MTPNTIARHLLLFTLTALGLTLAACGYFGRDDADVSYDVEAPIEFPEFDAAKLCPANQDCEGNAAPAPQERPLDPLDVEVDVDIVKLSGVDELATYSGKFRTITVSKITYSVEPNTLTFDLPAVDLYLAPLGTESSMSNAAVKFATIPPTPAGTVVSEEDATIIVENDAQISDLLKSLQLSALAASTPVVKKGQPFPPSGKAKIKATLFVTFTANALDATGL